MFNAMTEKTQWKHRPWRPNANIKGVGLAPAFSLESFDSSCYLLIGEWIWSGCPWELSSTYWRHSITVVVLVARDSTIDYLFLVLLMVKRFEACPESNFMQLSKSINSFQFLFISPLCIPYLLCAGHCALIQKNYCIPASMSERLVEARDRSMSGIKG